MFSTIARPSALILAAFLAAGCAPGGGGGGAPKPPDTRTALQYFKDEQAATVTPHGRIRTDTVTQSGDRIEYSTDNGMKWSVTYTKRADGTYRYNTPERIEQ